jgi:acyl-CoA thioesterase-1
LSTRLLHWHLLTVIVLTLPACGSTSSPAAPSPGALESGIVAVLGDSLAVTPSRGESFPAVLQARIVREGLPWTVTNAGVTGDTTAGGVRRIDAVLDEGADVLVLALGANDGLRGIDTATVEANLATIVETAQARGVRVLLCGMEAPPTYGLAYSVSFHQLFPRLAEEYDVPLVPFLLAGVALVPEMNGPDGIHPNAAGARRIAETVWPYLEPLLRRPLGSVKPAPLTTAAGRPRATFTK